MPANRVERCGGCRCSRHRDVFPRRRARRAGSDPRAERTARGKGRRDEVARSLLRQLLEDPFEFLAEPQVGASGRLRRAPRARSDRRPERRFACWSSKRPGVPTTSSGWRASARRSRPIDVPPVTTSTRRPFRWGEEPFELTADLRREFARGDDDEPDRPRREVTRSRSRTTGGRGRRIPGAVPFEARSASNSCASARPIATVLPDPVWEEMRRSRPENSASTTARCTGVSSVNPRATEGANDVSGNAREGVGRGHGVHRGGALRTDERDRKSTGDVGVQGVSAPPRSFGGRSSRRPGMGVARELSTGIRVQDRGGAPLSGRTWAGVSRAEGPATRAASTIATPRDRARARVSTTSVRHGSRAPPIARSGEPPRPSAASSPARSSDARPPPSR